MNNDRGKRVANFSQSRHNLSESTTPLQIHNFMPMSSSSVHAGQDLSESEKHAYFTNQLKQNMQSFWTKRLSEMHEAQAEGRTPHALPLARIKKVMKSDEKVKMMSADTPLLCAKACELFVMELTLRGWMHACKNRRRTVQRNDIADAIRDEDLFAFLKEMVPLEYHQAIPNNQGVYVPLPVRGVPLLPPNTPMCFNATPEEEATVAGDDRHLAFPMNFHDNISRGMQQNPSFLPASASDDGNNAYLIFKEFFG